MDGDDTPFEKMDVQSFFAANPDASKMIQQMMGKQKEKQESDNGVPQVEVNQGRLGMSTLVMGDYANVPDAHGAPVPAAVSGLLKAAQNGELEKVVKFLDDGVGIDATDCDGMTALHWSADGGHHPIAALLLDRGAAVNVKDESDETPLSLAVTCEHEEVALLLVGRGASLDSACLDDCSPELASRLRERAAAAAAASVKQQAAEE